MSERLINALQWIARHELSISKIKKIASSALESASAKDELTNDELTEMVGAGELSHYELYICRRAIAADRIRGDIS